jgi:hypothetical protein
MHGYDDSVTNFDLMIGSPTDTVADCIQNGPGQYAFCEFDAPGAGTWYAMVRGVSGVGPFQLTATMFRQ